jgi:predicted ATP-grasp superfamily ATP-dependent carboligase
MRSFDDPAPRRHDSADRRAAPQGAIVLGGDCGALTVVRGLGRKGIPVVSLSDNNRLAGFSRYARRVAWPGPLAPGAIPMLETLAAAVAGPWLLIPAGDAEVKLVADNHERLSRNFLLLTEPWDVLRHALDKQLAYDRAEALGIPVPRLYRPRSRADILDIDFRFPLVLKPALKQERNPLTLAKAWRVDDRAALLSRYDEAAALVGAEAVIIQELIPGDGTTQFSFGGLFRDGVPLASLVARRRRQFPADFGTGCFVETVRNDEVERLGTEFLASLGYTGLCEIEFKFDARDRSYRMIDVNPRVWTWTDLGRIGGVDMVETLWRMASGEEVSPRRRALAGARWMYLSRDLFAAMTELRAEKLTLSEWRDSFRHPVGFATFSVSDPLPALFDLPLGYVRRLSRSWGRDKTPAAPGGGGGR